MSNWKELLQSAVRGVVGFIDANLATLNSGPTQGWTYQQLPQQQYYYEPQPYRTGGQQPSYIQAQPWFQQPYYASQVPAQDRSATNQYANPFAGPFTPYNHVDF